MKTLLALILAVTAAHLYAAEGTTSPNVFDGLTLTGTIKPDRDDTAKAQPITLICKDATITAQWLADRGLKTLHVSPGGFSGKHVSTAAATQADSKPKARLDISTNDKEKFTGKLLIENPDLTNQTWLVEAEVQKSKKTQ